MKISELIQSLESVAPLALQESYDNCGLLAGDASAEITGVVISLDCVENTILQAIQNKCNLIISHHPLIFSPLKKLTGATQTERILISAIKNDIAIYAIHTNLDNVAEGVNKKIAEKLGLSDCKILQQKKALLKKLITYIPHAHVAQVRAALFDAGAGNIGNYDHCSFNVTGTGTFRGNDNSNAFIGAKNVEHQEPETRVEMIFPFWLEKTILTALLKNHPYEEAAYDIYTLENTHQSSGTGLIGSLPAPIPDAEFLQIVKDRMKTGIIRHTAFTGKPIIKVAVCGGSGSFLVQDALNAGADVFVTADIKYHTFFDTGNKMILADIGHFESEQFTVELLAEIIQRKFPNFAAPIIKGDSSNPVKYL